MIWLKRKLTRKLLSLFMVNYFPGHAWRFWLVNSMNNFIYSSSLDKVTLPFTPSVPRGVISSTGWQKRLLLRSILTRYCITLLYTSLFSLSYIFFIFLSIFSILLFLFSFPVIANFLSFFYFPLFIYVYVSVYLYISPIVICIYLLRRKSDASLLCDMTF